MSLLPLECPKCGAGLGAATPGGDHVCAHCGERSRPKVQVVHVPVPPKVVFNAVPTAAEMEARRKEFLASSSRDQAGREARAKQAASSAQTTSVGIILVVVGVVVVGVLAVAALVLTHACS